jgi:uncharacterized membrane protein YphA (DoxX/SURF4 family)
MGPESTSHPEAAEAFVAPSRPRSRWTVLERLLFRFGLCYLVLYIFPFPLQPLLVLLSGGMDSLFDKEKTPAHVKFLQENLEEPYEELWDKVVLWTGDKVFGKEIQYRPGGSGDTTWNYVQVFCFAVIAAALALLWTLAATLRWVIFRRERPAYPLLHEALRVYVRFYLAYFMLVYGITKVIKSQFPAPSPDTLLHTYGESSPMHLLWTFMGASEGYTVFAGAGEMLGGLLLVARRTTLLGALVTFAVMLHVAVLNFCYDVPVKLFSSHLVLMSVFLMLPDLPWMAKVFVLGRRAAPQGVSPLTRWTWMNWTLVVLRTMLVLAFVGMSLYDRYKISRVSGEHAPKPPLYGLWEVDEFAQDGEDRPPLITDATRWQRVVFTQRRFRGSSLFVISNMKGKQVVFFQVDVDQEAKTITLSRLTGPTGGDSPPPKYVIPYQEPEPGVMVLEGDLELPESRKLVQHHFRVRLRHVPEERFLLVGRGFHWINEVPYNRYSPRDEEPPPIPPPPKRP